MCQVIANDSRPASLAGINFPKAIAANAITRKEEAHEMMMTVTLKVTKRNKRLHHSELCFHVSGDSRPFSADTWMRNPIQLQIIPCSVFIVSALQ